MRSDSTLSSLLPSTETWQIILIAHTNWFRGTNVRLFSHWRPWVENHQESVHNDDGARMAHGQPRSFDRGPPLYQKDNERKPFQQEPSPDQPHQWEWSSEKGLYSQQLITHKLYREWSTEWSFTRRCFRVFKGKRSLADSFTYCRNERILTT